MKKIMKSTVISIGISTFIFCMIGIVFDMIYHGNFTMEGYSFTKMVSACILIGMGFGLPTVVYDKEAIPMPLQCVIHMGIGCVVYTIAAFWAGWIPADRGIGFCVLLVVAQLAVAFLIWFCFLKYYQRQAQNMNDRIREMNH